MAKNNAIGIDIETGGGNTYTFPSATSTLATLDLAETLTNKDLSAASNTLGSVNVQAAGALMDSEVTNLAQVKAFDSTDYATAAQGSTADSAVQDTGDETIAGVKTFSSNIVTQGVSSPTSELNIIDVANIVPIIYLTSAGAGTVNIPVISGGTTGNPVKIRTASAGDTNIDINLVPKGTGKVQANGAEVATVRGAVNAQTGTTYTLVIGDEYLDGVRMTNASANTLTIPPNSAVAFPVGTKVFITQGGAGSTTIAAGAGVTINAPSTVTLAIDEQWESRVCQKTGTNEWLLI